MKLTRVIYTILLMALFTIITSAQVGLVPADNGRFFSIKLTHLASHDYALLACDRQTGEMVIKTKQGIIFRSYNYNEIISTTAKIATKFASFVSTLEKKLAIKYEIANFNMKVGKLYGRF